MIVVSEMAAVVLVISEVKMDALIVVKTLEHLAEMGDSVVIACLMVDDSVFILTKVVS